MSNNNFLRIAGIAGILSMVCWLGVFFTQNPDVAAPPSPLTQMFIYGVALTGIVFAVGLYLVYRQDAAMLSLVAATVIVLGYLVGIIGALAKADVTVIAPLTEGGLVVGMFLFSWLAYSTRRMPRLLSIIGMIGGLAGVVVVVLLQLTGFGTNPIFTQNPILSAVGGLIYFAYILGLLVWVVWTGIVLLSGKYQPRTA